MTTVYDVPASELIVALKDELKKIDVIKPPEWAPFVKTGGNRERQPQDPDWWYTRAASLLRKVHINGPVGVPTLRRVYGGRKNRGVKPDAPARGSGSIIRNCLKQLESAGLVAKVSGGRTSSPQGVSLMDKAAHKIRMKHPELEKYR